MPDLTDKAIDDLPEQLRARAFAIQHNAAPETVRLLRVAAAALTAVRRGVNAMRADNARLREALANAVGALDAAGEDLSEFANILSREPNEANLTYQSARDAQDALALPLDAPAPVDPVAEAARIDAKDLYYLRAILRRLREFDAAIEEAIGDGADNISLLGNQAMADEIDWLDCKIDWLTALAQEARHEG